MSEIKKKAIVDFLLIENKTLTDTFNLLVLRPEKSIKLPDIKPGQFVQVKVPDTDSVFLRRPISICNFDEANNELWLLIRRAGKGTITLCDLEKDKKLNLVLPLGNGYSVPRSRAEEFILAGGGAGMAPLLYFGKELRRLNFRVKFLLGARTSSEILLLDEFKKYGNVYISTDDGSAGEVGLITQNSVLSQRLDSIYCCGPLPMMKAFAALSQKRGLNCEVSLENTMACGIGACLCCVEKTKDGNKCVCTDGPVFNINQLNW